MKVNFTTRRRNLATKRAGAKSKGFTLIELIISMVITLIIVGLLLGMTKVAVGAWSTTSKKVKSSRLAQEVFDVVGRDLEGMLVRTGNTYEWVAVTDSGLSGTDLGPNDDTEIKNSLDVFFFTATPDRYNGQINVEDVDKGGDVSLVKYRLVYQDVIDPDSGTRPVYSLYRERIEPDATFKYYLGEDEIETGFSVDPGPDPDTDINVNSVLDDENILAENIYDFTLSYTFEYTNDDGSKGYKRVVMQTGGDNELSITGNEILVNDADLDIPSTASGARLYSANISICVLSDSAMRTLQRAADSVDDFDDFVKKHGDIYSKSVLLPQP